MSTHQTDLSCEFRENLRGTDLAEISKFSASTKCTLTAEMLQDSAIKLILSGQSSSTSLLPFLKVSSFTE